MHAWFCDETSGLQGLQWREAPTPEPGPGEILIRVAAASLNFPDWLIVHGKYQFRPALPFVPGAEFAGLVQAVGPGVQGLQIGQRVATFAGVGGFATHAVVPAATAVALPDTLGTEEAAAFLCTYGTSHHALVDRAALQAGETVLVLGAAGGVGTAAIQIAKAAGARVIAAASTDEKCQLCREIGADATIAYGHEPLREALRRILPAGGPDVIVDPVGGDLAEPAFRSIAWRGRYLVVGFAQGSIPALPLNLPLLKGASIVGVFWGDFAKREPQRHAQAVQELARWHAQGRIRPVIGARLPMLDLPLAYARMNAREVQGKLVLVNG